MVLKKIEKLLILVGVLVFYITVYLMLEREGELKNIPDIPIAKQDTIVEEQVDCDNEIEVKSIEEMRTTKLNEKDVVKTIGYYDNLSIGSAKYKIVSNYSGVEDGLHIKLDNDMWAEMIIENNSVQPSQFGAYGDGIHDDTQSLQQAILSGYEVECEENATYTLSKGMLIPSKSILHGNNATIQVNEVRTFFYNESNLRENNSKGLFYYQFFMPVNYSEMNEEFNWSDLGIIWNVQQDIKHVGTYYIFMPKHIKEFYFSNVQIYVNGNESNNIQPIKFDGSAKKVDLFKCDIRNYTNAYAGGCLWFNVQDGGYPDFKLRNSYLYSEARDEVLSMWGRYGENVLVENTTIEKKNELCYNIDSSEKNLPPDVMLVSKASKRSENDVKSDATHLVTYRNCNFVSKGEGINYFFSSNSYYAEEMSTIFENCKIRGTFNNSFLTAETLGDAVDGITNAETQEEFQKALNVSFYNTSIDINTPTLATTHAPNFSISNCNIELEKCVIDLTYPNNRLINCWKGVFINNDIQIGNAKGIFINISDNYYLHLYFQKNNISIKNTDKQNEIIIITNQDYNIEKMTVRHSLGASSKYEISNNVINYKQ